MNILVFRPCLTFYLCEKILANAPFDSFSDAIPGNYNQYVDRAQHILIFDKSGAVSPLISVLIIHIVSHKDAVKTTKTWFIGLQYGFLD